MAEHLGREERLVGSRNGRETTHVGLGEGGYEVLEVDHRRAGRRGQR